MNGQIIALGFWDTGIIKQLKQLLLAARCRIACPVADSSDIRNTDICSLHLDDLPFTMIENSLCNRVVPIALTVDFSKKKLMVDRIERLDFEVNSASYLVAKLEIPIKTLIYTVKLAFGKSVKVVLNGTPVQVLPRKLLKYVSIITVNEEEIRKLVKKDVKDLGKIKLVLLKLYGRGVEAIIVALQSGGVLILYDDVFVEMGSSSSNRIYANDMFNAQLVIALQRGKTILEAVEVICGLSSREPKEKSQIVL